MCPDSLHVKNVSSLTGFKPFLENKYYTPEHICLLPPQVTLLHVESNQDLMSSHSFRVDNSVKNVTLHITGSLTECILTSPSGICAEKILVV